MPFPFILPTTSHLSFQSHLTSPSHPSLPTAATTARAILRTALKKHKRLPPAQQPSNLHIVLAAVTEYLPYLFALEAGLSSSVNSFISGDQIDVILTREIIVEWRPSLLATSSLQRREPPRIKGSGLDFEIAFTLATLSYVKISLARQKLHATLYAVGAASPTPEQRTTAITAATKHLLTAAGVHSYLSTRNTNFQFPSAAIDILPSITTALASISLAEATLLAVLKDDVYIAAEAQERNKHDKEWMIKAPEIPKVRAHLFARLCLRAGELSGLAGGGLGEKVKAEEFGEKGSSGGSGRPRPEFVKYVDDLRRVSRAKACRFFGVDRDLGGEAGEAIAWLQAGKAELGVASVRSGEKKGGLAAKLKKDFLEKKEDKRLEKGVEWGLDAGRAEEVRVLEALEKKWEKMNDMVSTIARLVENHHH